MSERKRYLAYLLRLWQESDVDPPLWRASLESPQSDERQGFASLADLFTFLEKQVCQIAQSQPQPNAGEKGGDSDT